VRGVVAAAVLISSALGAPSARALELPELAERTKPSVVVVTVFDGAGHKLGLGSGFFVSKDGRIVTNAHVIEDAATATATLMDGRTVDIDGVLARDVENDVAILHAAGDAYPPLTLGESTALAPGQEVFVIGNPLGLTGTLSAGVVAAIRDAGPTDDEAPLAHGGSWRIQITAAISPGSSGSPILTRDGRVVAVAVGARLGGESLNFGVPIEYARTMLDKLGEHAKPEALAGAKHASQSWRNLGISALVFAACAAAYTVWRRREERSPRRRATRTSS
jgi:S1-C subfamily serine protease